MTSIDHTIQRISAAFTARDIMVPRADLVCAEDAGAALAMFEKHGRMYSRIPIEQDGEICGYIEHAKRKMHPIDVTHLIGDATPILDVLDTLLEQEFCFVLSARRVVGFIHYTDLNNRVVGLPLYWLLSTVEQRLASDLRRTIGDTEFVDRLPGWGDLLGGPRGSRPQALSRQWNKLVSQDQEANWTSLLYFREVVGIAVHEGICPANMLDLDLLNDVRNRVAHPTKLLVTKRAGVRPLVDAKNACLKLLHELPE